LKRGLRGFAGGSSLFRVLAPLRTADRLTVAKIRQWGELHRKRTGKYPSRRSGAVIDAPAERWSAIDDALRGGWRGLRGGSSLAKLLGRKRPYTLRDIMAKAKAHRRRTGKWPGADSGPEWQAINQCLRRGHRGLRPGGSLSRLLRG
jgi:hypothetical protein